MTLLTLQQSVIYYEDKILAASMLFLLKVEHFTYLKSST